LHSKQARRGKGDEKSLALRHLKRICYGPPAQNRGSMTVSLPSGEFRFKQSSHWQGFFSAFASTFIN